MLTEAVLRKIAPNSKAELVSAVIDNWGEAEKAGLITDLRIAHFLAQIMTETGGLRAIEENLNYSADNLMATWPNRFPNAQSTLGYVKNPEALANKVYGGRMGNIKPGDGWRYRGGGMMQTTGRDNYRRVGFEDRPEALRQPVTAFLVALREWVRRGCNELADQDDVVAVRKAINGGTIGIDHTKKHLARAKSILSGSMAAVPDGLSPCKYGDTGPAVEALQRALNRLGEQLHIDGDFGPATKSAVVRFQLRHQPRLIVDGVVGPATIAALSHDLRRT